MSSTKWSSEAERLKAWRDRKRGRPARVYNKRPGYLSPYEHQLARTAERKLLNRARAISRAFDDPLFRAVMSRIKTDAS